ncbi:MAG: PAS domain-containing protein [Isosphaeraceae bacterium]
MTMLSAIATDRRTWRVVVVDDSPDDRAEIRRLLLRGSDWRLVFAEAETGAAGVRAVLDADGGPPDCLLLDYNLPDMSAPEVLAALAGPDGLPACPVVVITGSVGHQQSRQVLRAGAQDYVGKNWMTPECLTRAVENAAERWFMTRELRDSEAALRRSAERDAFRLALTDAIRPLVDPTAVKNEAARVLGTHLRASRVVYAEVLPDGQLVIERSYTDGVSDMPGRHYVDDHSALLLRELRAGRNIVVADVTNDPAFIEADKERYRAAQIVASLVVPLLKDGQLIAILGVHQSSPRRWTTEDVALAEETAERTWSEVGRARAEAAVRDRESLLSLAFDAADLMLFTWDIPKDRVERRMSRIPALPSSNGVGRGPTTFAEVIEVVHPDDRVRFEAAVRAALAGSGPYAQAYRVVQPDGSVLWIEEQGRVSFDGIGRPVRLVGVATDVTARRAAERAVQESEARLRLALDDAREAEEAVRKSEELLTRAQRAARVGIWDWNVVTGEANWTEESWRLFGHPPFSRPVTHELWLESVHPDDRDQMVAKVQEALQSGKYAAEYRVRHADGTVRWVESRGETEFAPDGRPVRMLGTSRDVTERRVAEEKLRRREWELQTLADNSPDILTRFDPNLRHVFVNAAVLKVTGRQREEYLGKTNHELGMPADLCQLWEDALRSVFGTGLQRSIEFAFPTAAGIRHYSARLVPEFGPEGTVEYVISVTHDVTDHKRYEEALRDQDRRKDEFLATLAHELRNPLAPIRNGLQILRLAPDGEDALEIREMMERQLAHMVRLIDDLLDVSRISRGKFELKRELVQVQDVLDHAIETSQPLIEAGRHELIIQPPNEPVWLDGDLTRLAQVVSNLLNNSAKYTPNGGRITLWAGFEGDNAVIRVTDNGSGISAEMLTQVFEMFTQVDRTLDRAQGGLGIGLSLVRRLVEMHGGTIEADSPGLGLGSVFTVRLPVALPPMTRSISGTPPERPERSSSSTLRVLLVDDSDDGATSLALLLQVWGHTTRIADDGPQAIEAAREFRPDLVFLDIGLPVMDGYEVCRRLRDNPDLSRTIFVALTGWGGEEDKKRAQDAGFAFHLVKPVNPDQIEDVLKKTVEGRER